MVTDTQSALKKMLADDGLPLNTEGSVLLRHDADSFQIVKRGDAYTWITVDKARDLVRTVMNSPADYQVHAGQVQLTDQESRAAMAYLRTFVNGNYSLWLRTRMLIKPMFDLGEPIARVWQALVTWITDTVSETLHFFFNGALSKASGWKGRIRWLVLLFNVILTVLLLFGKTLWNLARRFIPDDEKSIFKMSENLKELRENTEVRRQVDEAVAAVTGKVAASFLADVCWNISDRIGVEFKSGDVIPYRRHGLISATESKQLWMGRLCRHRVPLCTTAQTQAALATAVAKEDATIDSVATALDAVTSLPADREPLQAGWLVLKNHVAAHLLLRQLTVHPKAVNAQQLHSNIQTFVCGELENNDPLYQGAKLVRSVIAAFVWNAVDVLCSKTTSKKQALMATSFSGVVSEAMDTMNTNRRKKHFYQSHFSECDADHPKICHDDETLLAALLRYQNILCILKAPPSFDAFQLREASPTTVIDARPSLVATPRTRPQTSVIAA
jgi:hypothetical protein